MFWLIALLVIVCLWAYAKLSLLTGTLLLAGYFVLLSWLQDSNIVIVLSAFTFTLLFIPLNIPFFRKKYFSLPIFRLMQLALPKMSQTEREALEAGNTWWDAQLFSGQPDWKVLQDLPAAKLSAEEQAFIDGPVETLCSMLDDWDITHHRKDLPPEVWRYIKQHKFCGMIIPKHFGGLEFSDFAHSEVVMKLASRSTTAAVTVMVPNSLGPAKLLLAYGTDQQKDHFLPRLACGDDLPAFALTGPHAGSDASAMPDNGIVCYSEFDGQHKVLGIRLNWEKRYITLGPVATVLGLAFKLYDPDQLIGEQENIGITVALIPTNTPGVSIGRRHNPLDSAFQNGPNWGKDVFIPMDWVIGGIDQVGNGWKMLMQCLATGRALSLPALSAGAAKYTCRNVGAYARIRKQFNLPIGEFEGIEEPLARMAGETYIIDAARSITAAALDDGQKPAVISAVIKYELTERMRRVVNDGMDIQGGAGICLGPKNFLGRLYQVVPVSITVEGANILTRTMMIFGQGAIRCHPYIQKEMAALANNQPNQALQEFDNVLFKHIGFIMHNLVNSLWLGLTNAHFTDTPGDQNTQIYFRKLARLTANFALATDFALLSLGGTLKRKERISGSFADALSNLYLCSCVLKHYQNQGSRQEDLPLLLWACEHTLYSAQEALMKISYMLPSKALSLVLKLAIFPIGKPLLPPTDKLTHQLATLLITDTSCRDRLTRGIYINKNPIDVTGKIEIAFQAVLAAAPIEDKIHLAQKQLQLPKGNILSVIEQTLSQGIATKTEVDLVLAAEQARLIAITVDDFGHEL